MKAKIVLLTMLSILLIASACRNKRKENVRINDQEKKPQSVQNGVKTDKNETVDKSLLSFALSCGSGCAMTYTAESITGSPPVMNVKFRVDMFVDEKLIDTYNEVYIFYYDRSNQIKQIHLEGKHDDLLKTLMPDAQRSFRNLANNLIKSNGNEATALSNVVYNKIHDPGNAVYETLKTSSVKGLNEYSCNKENTRYIQLPSRSDIKLMLIPQDCGDFEYRYYLIAVKNNEVTGNLYVEGEWYEPDNESEKEVRSFTINDKHQVSIKIQSKDSLKSELYVISDNGAFVKN